MRKTGLAIADIMYTELETALMERASIKFTLKPADKKAGGPGHWVP